MLVFLFFYLIMLFVATSGNSNHSPIPCGRVAGDPGSSSYPYHPTAVLWMIPNLPGGLRYASSDAPGLNVLFVVQPDDPNAGGLTGRLAGGGTRRDIHGNKWVSVFRGASTWLRPVPYFLLGVTAVVTQIPLRRASKAETCPSFSARSVMGDTRATAYPTSMTTSTVDRMTSTAQAALYILSLSSLRNRSSGGHTQRYHP